MGNESPTRLTASDPNCRLCPEIIGRSVLSRGSEYYLTTRRKLTRLSRIRARFRNRRGQDLSSRFLWCFSVKLPRSSATYLIPDISRAPENTRPVFSTGARFLRRGPARFRRKHHVAPHHRRTPRICVRDAFLRACMRADDGKRAQPPT